jgi:hypothetical protein
MPTPICENDATEQDKITTASTSQRIMARSFCINLSPKVRTKRPEPFQRKRHRAAKLCRKLWHLAELRSSPVNPEVGSMLLRSEIIWNQQVGKAERPTGSGPGK